MNLKASFLIFLLAIGALGKAGAGEVETNPPFKQQNGQLFIFAEKDHPVTFTAKKDKGSVTTSISATGGGSTSSGSGDTQTYTPNENAGVYTVTITVNHTGDNAKECTTNKPFTFTVATAKVEFADVVREDDLPNSISPGVEKEIQVTTTPSPLPTGHSATIVVDNGGAATNGSASITDPSSATITQSGTIKIKGGTTQTKPGKAGKLKLKAQLDGDANKIIGEGKGFSTCAHPVEFEETLAEKRDSQSAPGSLCYFEYAWKSDSGKISDLNAVKVGEHVAVGTLPSPPFGSGWNPPNPTVLNVWGSDGKCIDTIKWVNSWKTPYVAANVLSTQNLRYHCNRCMPDSDMKLLPWGKVLMGPIEIHWIVEETSPGVWKFHSEKGSVVGDPFTLP